ncbi:hypothetical protein Tco_0384917 [Tanacetum coccineum]
MVSEKRFRVKSSIDQGERCDLVNDLSLSTSTGRISSYWVLDHGLLLYDVGSIDLVCHQCDNPHWLGDFFTPICSAYSICDFHLSGFVSINPASDHSVQDDPSGKQVPWSGGAPLQVSIGEESFSGLST